MSFIFTRKAEVLITLVPLTAEQKRGRRTALF